MEHGKIYIYIYFNFQLTFRILYPIAMKIIGKWKICEPLLLQ